MSAIILMLVVGVSLLFFVLLFCVALWEKHPLEQWVPADLKELPEPSKYFLAVNESAQALGFEFIGAYRQQRTSGIYGAYYALWISPDRRTLARVCGGKVLGVPEKKMLLISFLTDNHIIQSTDWPATRDLSDVTDGKALLNAHLPELYAFHQDRLAAQSVSLRLFEKTRAAEMIESLAAMKATRLKELGLARFTNPEQTIWCYSVSGAWRVCTSFQRTKDEAMLQAERRKLKRPGDV